MMRVGYVQFKPVFGEIGHNVARMTDMISSVDADLLVLPELATSGYTFTERDEAVSMAEPFEASPSLDALQQVAVERDCALVVGFPESAGTALYNSAAFLSPDGNRALYRKIHLFDREALWFEPGDRKPETVDFRGVRLGMMVCFDWAFPEIARILSLEGAHILCHPANFVLDWGQRAMVIRGYENGVFTITANRYGDDGRPGLPVTFTGRSQVTTPLGDVPASSPEQGDDVRVVDIDPAAAEGKLFGGRFNDLFASRRPDMYGNILLTGNGTADDTPVQ